MPREKPTDGYRERLLQALERGPRPMSVRELARRAGAEYPNVRGTSYGGVRQYVQQDGIRNPRVDLLRAFADVLGVRPDWLAFGDEPMTEEQRLAEGVTAAERAALEADIISNIESSAYGALHEELPRLTNGLLRTHARLVGMMEQVVGSMAFHVRHTEIFRSIALDKSLKGEARSFALQRRTKEAAVREIARAVRGPADALGVDLDELNEDHFALYVDAVSTALSVLIMDPRHYLSPEDRMRLPATQAVVKAKPDIVEPKKAKRSRGRTTKKGANDAEA